MNECTAQTADHICILNEVFTLITDRMDLLGNTQSRIQFKPADTFGMNVSNVARDAPLLETTSKGKSQLAIL